MAKIKSDLRGQNSIIHELSVNKQQAELNVIMLNHHFKLDSMQYGGDDEC